jgi:RNA polymerase sigma-70 factor (ECF subfamily)
LSWDLQKLFENHAAEIMRSLRRRGLSAETAADITQDAFVRLLTAEPANGRADGNPRAYLHRISRNLSIDHRRRERLAPRMDVTDEEFQRIADPAPSQETVVYDKQRLISTQRAIEELPERTRRAFELHRLDERTISEVAQELGLSTTRTWVLIRDAYRHIRARLVHD